MIMNKKEALNKVDIQTPIKDIINLLLHLKINE